MHGQLTQVERNIVKLKEKEGPTPLDQKRPTIWKSWPKNMTMILNNVM